MKLRKRFGVVLVLAMLVSVLAMTMTASAAKAKKTKISQKTATIAAGKSVKLSVKNAKGKKVTWKSEDEDIAKVGSSGKVTGLRGGEAVIVAKVGGKSYKCSVTVEAVKFVNLNREDPRISLTGQDLTNTDATNLFYGKNQYDLKANVQVYPAGLAVKWSTSDAKVATVDNGVVTAVANGTCTVTAEATDGSGAKDTVVIWVTNMGQGANSTNPIYISGENKAEFAKYFDKLKVTTYVYDKDGKLLPVGTPIKEEVKNDFFGDMFDEFYNYEDGVYVEWYGVKYPAKDNYYYYLKATGFDARQSSGTMVLGYKNSNYKVYFKDDKGKAVAKPIIEYKDTTADNDSFILDVNTSFPAADYTEIKYKDGNEWKTGSVQMFYSTPGFAGKTIMAFEYGEEFYTDTVKTFSDEIVTGAMVTLYK